MNALSHSSKHRAALPASSASHPTLTALPLTGARVHANEDATSAEHGDANNPLWLMVFAMALFFALLAALLA